MSLFKLSNQIFQLRLDAQEVSVYAYLCSLPTAQHTITGEATVRVKQSTIAQNCGIRSLQTVAKIISHLQNKGLTDRLERSVKVNRHKGTYSYAVKQLPLDSGYFFVDRHIFGCLNPRQTMIYLFICKSYSPSLHDCWNSYNDIAQQTGMKRETVIQTVNELVQLHFIVRCRRKSRDNKHVFVDNHYQVVFFGQGNFKGKKRVRLYRNYNRTEVEVRLHSRPIIHYHHSTFTGKSQYLLQYFFAVRGSP